LVDAEATQSIGKLIDPYGDRRDLVEALPGGEVINLFPMPSAIAEQFPESFLAMLVENELKVLEPVVSKLDDEDVALMAQLTAFAYGAYDPPEVRESALRFVVANASWRVIQYIRDHPGPWNSLPLVPVHFPNQVELQRRRLLSAEVDPPFRVEELECFTEEEIRAFGHAQQATYASPRARHFMICPRCFVTVINRQRDILEFLALDPDDTELLAA
jgi:hypothetical protein